MSKYCPIYDNQVLYIDCLECEEKKCKKMKKNKIVIGIDQSHKDTGISIAFNGQIKAVTHCFTDNLPNNSEKRYCLKETLTKVLDKSNKMSLKHNADVIVIIERIRLRSQGFININYIKSIGALNAVIVDCVALYGYHTYSVDTRAWKSSIVGNSKGLENQYGFDPKKYPTILWCIKNGYEKYIIEDAGKKKKGVIIKDGKKITYNDNKADSICIALYGFVDNQKLEVEH